MVDDKQLVRRAKHDPEAFGQLYELYFNRVYRYVLSRVGNPGWAEDVVSEIWFKVLNSIKKYDDRGTPFAAWLFTVAANTIKDHYRRQKPAIPLEAIEGSLALPDAEQGVLSRLQMEQAISRLTSDQQDVVLLRFTADLPLKEIAISLGKTEGAVKALLVRALNVLRQEFIKGGKTGAEQLPGYRGSLEGNRCCP
ncbi:MAG: RNA polymerase sigma factor [Bacillota bacterium]